MSEEDIGEMRLMGPDHIGHRRRRHPAGRHEENVRDLQLLYVDKKAHCCAMTVLFLATAFVIGLCTGRSSLGHVLADGAELFHRSNYHLCLFSYSFVGEPEVWRTGERNSRLPIGESYE